MRLLEQLALFSGYAFLIVAIVALALSLAGCAPRTLRASVCMQPAPGLQACSFHYEGDEE